PTVVVVWFVDCDLVHDVLAAVNRGNGFTDQPPHVPHEHHHQTDDGDLQNINDHAATLLLKTSSMITASYRRIEAIHSWATWSCSFAASITAAAFLYRSITDEFKSSSVQYRNALSRPSWEPSGNTRSRNGSIWIPSSGLFSASSKYSEFLIKD